MSVGALFLGYKWPPSHYVLASSFQGEHGNSGHKDFLFQITRLIKCKDSHKMVKDIINQVGDKGITLKIYKNS